MILYHVSDRIDRVERKEFIPKVPSSTASSGEDKTIKRICFAPSITKCIEAIGLDTDMQEYITVYKLNTDDIGDDNLIRPNTLKFMGLVYDAMETQEHWVLCPVTLEPEYYQIIDASWAIAGDGKHKELTELNMVKVDYSAINNPFGGAIAAMFGE